MTAKPATPLPWQFRSRLGFREYFRGDVVIGRRFSSNFKNGGGVSGTMHWVIEHDGRFIARAKTLAEAKALSGAKGLS